MRYLIAHVSVNTHSHELFAQTVCRNNSCQCETALRMSQLEILRQTYAEQVTDIKTSKCRVLWHSTAVLFESVADTVGMFMYLL